jgi:hypothetical protein
MRAKIRRAVLIQNIVDCYTTTGSSTDFDEMVVDFQGSFTNSIYWIDFFRHVLSYASNDLLTSCQRMARSLTTNQDWFVRHLLMSLLDFRTLGGFLMNLSA